MMKILQISLLWIAGFMILGHSVIPHHHHDIEKHQCETKNNQHIEAEHQNCSHENHQVLSNDQLLSVENNCLCEHKHDQENICHLFQRTIIQQIDGLTAAIIIQAFGSFEPTEPDNNFPLFNSELKEFHLIGKLSGRAPPMG